MTLLLIFCGFFTALTQMVDRLSPLAYLSMVPLVYALIETAKRKLSFRRTYLVGLSFALPCFITVFHWFWYLYPFEFLGISKLAAVGIILFCWLGLASLQGFSFACFALFFRQASCHPALSPLLFAAVWTVSEWLQTLTWAGVPWARLALSQTSFLPAVQSAELIGSFGVTFIIALVNGILGWGLWKLCPDLPLKGNPFKQIKQNLSPEWKTTLLRYTSLALAVVFANIGYGTIRLAAFENDPDRRISAALIQGNIASGEKWESDGERAIDIYLDLSEKAIEEADADILLWPETVLTYAVKAYPSVAYSISALAQDSGTIIYVGAFDRLTNEEGETDSYNAIIGFYPDGSVEETPYYKQHLVPFGEYLPMEDFFNTFLPFLGEMNLFSSPLSSREASAIDETAYGKVGRLVCFDSIYPTLSRQSVADGAEILLLSTNDSWYLDSPAVYQHNAHACLRAIENGRWVLRAANTGITSLITPTGEVTEYLEPLVQGYVTGEAYFSSERTLYSYTGDLIVLLCFGFIFFEGECRVYGYVRRKKAKNE